MQLSDKTRYKDKIATAIGRRIEKMMKREKNVRLVPSERSKEVSKYSPSISVRNMGTLGNDLAKLVLGARKRNIGKTGRKKERGESGEMRKDNDKEVEFFVERKRTGGWGKKREGGRGTREDLRRVGSSLASYFSDTLRVPIFHDKSSILLAYDPSVNHPRRGGASCPWCPMPARENERDWN